jgi:hypothetical protein
MRPARRGNAKLICRIHPLRTLGLDSKPYALGPAPSEAAIRLRQL